MLDAFSSHTYEMESGRDPLTRLLNRRFLPAVMQNMIRISKASSSTFSVFSCDIDDFKQINDQYGHDVGDQALVQFGDFLASALRATDYVFRMGGDEFLIVLAGANQKLSINIVTKLLEKIEAHTFSLGSDLMLSLKTSIGVVEHDGHPDYSRILKAADEALYEAKRKGKNTFYLHTPAAR
jgi:diguanylate cyclase